MFVASIKPTQILYENPALEMASAYCSTRGSMSCHGRSSPGVQSNHEELKILVEYLVENGLRFTKLKLNVTPTERRFKSDRKKTERKSESSFVSAAFCCVIVNCPIQKSLNPGDVFFSEQEFS